VVNSSITCKGDKVKHACREFDSSKIIIFIRYFLDRAATTLLSIAFLAIVGAFTITISSAPLHAEDNVPDDLDLGDLSLEDLMNIEVTSVSRKAELQTNAPSAIYVLTGEDIKKSGALTIPDALRIVPGLQVAQIDANKWAITSRGFAGNFSNKLLVMIDGRTVYTPMFSGVYWDVQDVPLEDIARIEVIRGPGATMWGANAVNGVISIVTKNSAETNGTHVSFGAGSGQRQSGLVRYGSGWGSQGNVRAYVKYLNEGNSKFQSGAEAADDWRLSRVGFRADFGSMGKDAITIHGDYYDGLAGTTYLAPSVTPPYYELTQMDALIDGGNVATRWNHRISSTSDLKLGMYFDRTRRLAGLEREIRSTLDFDFQHAFQVSRWSDFIWGIGFRLSDGQSEPTSQAFLLPGSRTDKLYSGFVQSDFKLVARRLNLILGSKIEHNDYTGLETEPSGRVVWTPNEKHTFWGAVSKSVRTPSWIEHNSRVLWASIPPLSLGNPSPLPAVLTLTGNPDFKSEVCLAHEAGYRYLISDRLLLDLATFYNSYSSLRVTTRSAPALNSSQSAFVIPVLFKNDMEGETYGFELAADWSPIRWLRTRATYSHLQMDLRAPGNSSDTVHIAADGDSPRHQLRVGSSLNLPHDIDFSFEFRFVSALPHLGVDEYGEVDSRLGWKFTENLELALTGRNLLHKRHFEFKSELSNLDTAVGRSVFLSITWR